MTPRWRTWWGEVGAWIVVVATFAAMGALFWLLTGCVAPDAVDFSPVLEATSRIESRIESVASAQAAGQIGLSNEIRQATSGRDTIYGEGWNDRALRYGLYVAAGMLGIVYLMLKQREIHWRAKAAKALGEGRG